MRDIWLYKNSSIKERYYRLGLNFRKGNQTQKSLFSKGLVFSINLSSDRGKTKGLLLTDKGCEVLGINTGKSNRHGGAEHRFWVARIAEHFRANAYDVATEVPVGGGKTIDIVALCNDKRIAIEIETGKSEALANIKKCIDAGLDRVIVVATSVMVHDKLSHMLPKHNAVEIVTTLELLNRYRW